MFNKSLQITVLSLCLVGAGLISSCAPPEEPTATQPTIQPVTPTPGVTPATPAPATGAANVFDPSQIKAGDRVSGLELVSVNANQSQGQNYGNAQFRGEVTVSGTYRPHPETAGGQQPPCFFPDEASAQQLPRFAGDDRTPWFCFTNPTEVEQGLGPLTPEGKQATVVIDNYQTVYQPTDVYNTATLLRVVSQASPAASLPSVEPLTMLIDPKLVTHL